MGQTQTLLLLLTLNDCFWPMLPVRDLEGNGRFRCLCVIGYNASTIVDVMDASTYRIGSGKLQKRVPALNQTHQGARWNVPTRRTRRTRHAYYCVWFGFDKECHVMPLHWVAHSDSID